MHYPKSAIVLLFMLSAHVAGAADMPMMIHSDAKRFTEEGRVNACALLLTATSINGQFISAVIKLRQRPVAQATLEYTVSSGHVDYTNGRETFDYVEKAWLSNDNFSTRDNLDKAGRGPSNYAYKGYYSTGNAVEFYQQMTNKPFELTLITSLHRQPYIQKFEQSFDSFVLKKARSCLKEFRMATVH